MIICNFVIKVKFLSKIVFLSKFAKLNRVGIFCSCEKIFSQSKCKATKEILFDIKNMKII